MQVLLYSSRTFGPTSIRELTVGRPCARLCFCGVKNSIMHARGNSCYVDCKSFKLLLLQSEHVSRLVRIPGIVTSASKPKVFPGQMYARS